MTTIDSLPKFNEEDTINRCLALAKLLINHLPSKVNFGEYALDYFTEEVSGSAEINHLQLTKKVPGMFTPGVITGGTRVLMNFGIWTSGSGTVIHHGYGPWSEIHAALEEFVWRHFVLEPMLLEIVNKLKRSGSGKLGIKTAEHTWNFSFLGTTDYVEILSDNIVRKRMSIRWNADGSVEHLFCVIPYRETNTIIYSMLHQQGLV